MMDRITFIEKYCVIKNKTTNKIHNIKLSNAQKSFIKNLENIKK